jgi:hypothetical protein
MGVHRVSWDLRLDPVSDADVPQGSDDDATGAVPHRTYGEVYAPWAPPGQYTVRLTAGGKSVTQPLTLRLDPRVKTPPAALAQLATLTRSLYDDAVAAHAAARQAGALRGRLDSLGVTDASFRAQVESLAPAPARPGAAGRGPGRFRRGGAAAAPTLESASSALVAAAMAMQSADVAPTADQVAAANTARQRAASVMARWRVLQSTGLASVNAKRRAAGQPPVAVPPSR